MAMEISRLCTIDDTAVAAVQRLLPQLSPTSVPPNADQLAAIIAQPGTMLLVAVEACSIVGMLTLVTFRIPSGLRAWIEDVAVDQAARGRGVGEALSRAAIEHARALGARTVELTSRPTREAANRLYRRIGFEPRSTNLYRLAL